MMDSNKYKVGYYPVSGEYNKWVNKDHIEKAPVWCSVDMRDGNQSLVIPRKSWNISRCFSMLALRRSKSVSPPQAKLNMSVSGHSSTII